MNKAKRAVFFVLDLIVMAGLVFIDRYTKLQAVGRLKDKEPYRLIPGVFEFRYLENRGAAFGMLQDMRTLFIVVGAVFIAIVLYLLIRVPATAKYRLLRICLVMIGAGAIGNLYDRITLNYVIDFLYFIYIDFPIFNVADIYVTVSAAMLVVLFLFVYKDEDLDMKKANTPKIHSSMLPKKDGEDAEDEENSEDGTDGADGENEEDNEDGEDTRDGEASEASEDSGSGEDAEPKADEADGEDEVSGEDKKTGAEESSETEDGE